MSQPKRIQLSPAKGWRKPEGAISVVYPRRWSNPFTVESVRCDVDAGVTCWKVSTEAGFSGPQVWADHLHNAAAARARAVELYALHTGPLGDYEYDDAMIAALKAELAGHDLMCWCPLDQACHADLLLEIANMT